MSKFRIRFNTICSEYIPNKFLTVATIYDILYKPIIYNIYLKIIKVISYNVFETLQTSIGVFNTIFACQIIVMY